MDQDQDYIRMSGVSVTAGAAGANNNNRNMQKKNEHNIIFHIKCHTYKHTHSFLSSVPTFYAYIMQYNNE